MLENDRKKLGIYSTKPDQPSEDGKLVKSLRRWALKKGWLIDALKNVILLDRTLGLTDFA